MTKSRVQSPTPINREQASAVKNSPAMMIVFGAIADERLRQRQLLREGKILFNCDSPIVDLDRKLRVLMEEVGEVAREVDHIERGSEIARAKLRTELTQVAAVATAWLESFEVKS